MTLTTEHSAATSEQGESIVVAGRTPEQGRRPSQSGPLAIALAALDFQDFGGLEEILVELAIGLQEDGNDVTVYTCTWASHENQYVRRLRDANVRLVQPNRALSHLAQDWATKERLLAVLMRCLAPLTFLLAAYDKLVRGKDWRSARHSAFCWLRGRVGKIILRDRRPWLARWTLRADWMRRRPDVIHIHGFTKNLLFLLEWAARQGPPVVYEEHSTPDERFDWWDGFEAIGKADVVLACSEASAAALRRISGTQTAVLPRAPLCPDPCADGQSPPARLKKGPLTVTVIARLDTAKGLPHFLEAAAIVRRRRPGTMFRIFGDGQLREELSTYASSLGLDAAKILRGRFERSELPRIMAETDVWASASLVEGQSIALLEAMAFGCAIVTTNVGGSAEVIEHDRNGLLCAPGNPEELARAIERVADSAELRRRLGAAARRDYEGGPFQRHQVANATAKIYRRLLREKAI